jgi:alpha-1,6-mannosyltransferase
MKVLDVTEFFSHRGGGVRSHLATKHQVLCQASSDSQKVQHRVLAPGAKSSSGAVTAQWPPEQAAGKDGRTLPGYVDFLAGPAMPYDPTYHALVNPYAVRQYIEKREPDVLEIHSPYVAAIGALIAPRKSFKVRTLMWHSDFIDTYQGVLASRSQRTERVLRPAITSLWAWVRMLTNACDASIVASKHQADKLKDHGVKRVHFLPFGVDKHVFTPSRRQPTESAPVLVAIGRMAIEKRWDLIFAAYAILKQSFPAARLWVLGDGPEREALERLAPPDSNFLDFERDRNVVATRLASADLLLHACPYETFGLGVAEALSAGVCAVLPDQGGTAAWAHLPSVKLYKSLDLEALVASAKTWLNLPSHERLAFGAKGAALVPSEAEHFDKLLALYTHLLERPRP